MPKLIINWQTRQDHKVCPVCRPLHGHQWIFVAGVDSFPKNLVADGKIVWDMENDTPRTHGSHTYNCRCKLVYDVDASDVEELLKNVEGRL